MVGARLKSSLAWLFSWEMSKSAVKNMMKQMTPLEILAQNFLVASPPAFLWVEMAKPNVTGQGTIFSHSHGGPYTVK